MPIFYTRNGDDGYTGLLGKNRVPKYDLIPETLGMLDEVMAVIGLARSVSLTQLSSPILIQIQRDLYDMMAEISASPENADQFKKIDTKNVNWLEMQIDEISKRVDLPLDFILPGDTQSGATFALARTITRRAERQVARIFHGGLMKNNDILRYINRLSSLCYILEIYETKQGGKKIPTRAKDAQ
jgi:cob(I)alamin adenosyltransferase